MLRIVYMGTPYFAVPALKALIERSAPGDLLPEGYEIVTVVTRPDKPAGRGRHVAYSPVKQCALDHNIPIWQPGSLKRASNADALAAYNADLYIVAAFGQILPQRVLDQPRFGTLNIHASLLPKYRGADPIAEAILQGDEYTGISIMLLDAGIDTGPVLLQHTVAITEEDTTGSLTARLAHCGADTLLEALPLWIAKKITPEPQDAARATHTYLLKKEQGKIQWDQPATVIARQIRAYLPWPGSFTFWHGRLLKILSAQPLQVELDGDFEPGTVIVREVAGQKGLAVVTGSGLLLLKQVQPEGKRAMSVDEFLRGYGQIVGQILG